MPISGMQGGVSVRCAGVAGLVLKRATTADLVPPAEDAHRGRIYTSPDVVASRPRHPSRTTTISRDASRGATRKPRKTGRRPATRTKEGHMHNDWTKPAAVAIPEGGF